MCHEREPEPYDPAVNPSPLIFLNSYGIDVVVALYDTPYTSGDRSTLQTREAWMTTFETHLPAALAAVEGDDSDGDGQSNLEEIELGTIPGDALSHFTAPADPTGDINPDYDVTGYDARFAFRRVATTYCGRAPSYDEVQAFADADAQAQQTLLHAKLDECTDTNYWKSYALRRLADNRIRPIQAVGKYSTIGVALGDYYADYRLFSYVMTGDRDARDLLLADYFIDHEGNVVDNPYENPAPGNAASERQHVPGPDRDADGVALNDDHARAGMITTRWFMVANTMFSELPRTSAAQAMRAYLGEDIGMSEGLRPSLGEPIDPDGKGVTEEACARCHSTLDPLAYAFTYYEGIDFGGTSGEFNADRPPWPDFETNVVMEIYGQPITDAATRGVRSWAEVAANSDAFKRNLVEMMLGQALRRELGPEEAVVVKNLMSTVEDDAYNVNALLHRIVDTDVFGRP